MAKLYGRDSVLAWQRALNDAVDEVIDVAAQEGIDAGIVKGGTLRVARNPAQASRLAAEVAEERSWKVDGIAELTKAEAAHRIQLDGVVSAYHNPHCARVQPARLVRGLADTVERLGVDHLRTVTGNRHRGRAGDHAVGDRHRACRAAGDGGIHRRTARAAAALAADEQFDDRYRSDRRRRVGFDRLARPRHARRHRARLLLRPAHRRRPDRDRRPQRAVPLRVAHRHRRARAAAHHPAPDRHAARRAAADPRRADRPRMVRCARRAAGLGGQRRARQGHRIGLGRRVRRATASPPPTSPDAPWPIWSSTGTRR